MGKEDTVKSSMFRIVSVGILGGLALPASAATITGWNLGNVDLVPHPGEPSLGVSNIYDRDVSGGTAGATSNGRILWTASPVPGMTVLNDDADLNPGQSIPDCIVAVGANCEGPFQSDKRVKMVATKVGAIDLVFDTQADSETNSYQLFHRLINVTPQALTGFKIELGYGVGDAFVASGLGDGLAFDLSVALGPNNVPAFTQFSFGLFGDAAQNPNFDLDGFFATERAGFNLDIGEDVIATNGLYGPYRNLFGAAMLNEASVPEGYFWDNDGDALTDPLLMAWFNGSSWEARRAIDPNDPFGAISIAPTLVAEGDLLALGFSRDIIEDLRNLNVNLNIQTDQSFAGSQFTLRFNTAAVPEPASWAMMIAGFGLVGGMARRRRMAAATSAT